MGLFGGSGGAPSIAASVEAAQKARDLAAKTNNQNRVDALPWYAAGSGAVNQLAQLMGINQTFSKDRTMIKQELVAAGKWPNVKDNAAKNALIDAELARQKAEFDAQQKAAQQSGTYGSLAKPFGMEDYKQDPGYQFRLGEGNKALERQLAASGRSFTPDALKAIDEYNQGMGAQEYGAAYDRYNTDQNNLYSRLFGLSGQGQQSQGMMQQSARDFTDYTTNNLTDVGALIDAQAAASKASKGNSMFNKLANLGVSLGTSYLTGGLSGSPLSGFLGGGGSVLGGTNSGFTNAGWQNWLAQR